MATSLSGRSGFGGNRTGQTDNQMTGYGQMQGNMIPNGYQMGQLQQFSPEQMDLFKKLFSQTGGDSQLGRLASGDQAQFEQMEAPALRQLGQLQGGLASRFYGMGLGARNSSGNKQAQGGLASDFAERLAGNRMGLQRQALMDLFGLSDTLFNQRPNENFLIQNATKQKSILEQLLSGALPIAGALGGGLLGGLPGASLGGSIGSTVAQGFMGY